MNVAIPKQEFFVGSEVNAIAVKLLNISQQFLNGMMIKKTALENLKQILTSNLNYKQIGNMLSISYFIKSFINILFGEILGWAPLVDPPLPIKHLLKSFFKGTQMQI